MGTTANLLRSEKHDTPTHPMERSPSRTTNPENKDQPASVNILRVVRDHSPATIEELQEAINELKADLADKERELEFNMRLKAISDEYYS